VSAQKLNAPSAQNQHQRAVASGYELNTLPVAPPDAPSIKHPGKTPGVRNASGAWNYFPSWQKEQQTTPALARAYDAWGAGLGFRAGVQGLTGLDLDITDVSTHQLVKNFFLDQIGEPRLSSFPERSVDYPGHVKSLLMCVVIDPFDQPVALGSTDIHFDSQTVQVLAAGRYFNAYGTHPDRLRPYVWNQDILALGLQGLPRVQESDFLGFIRALPGFLEANGYKVSSRGHARLAGAWKQLVNRETLPNDTIIKIMRIVPNDLWGYDAWISTGMTLKGAAEDPDDQALLNTWVSWSNKWTGPRARGKYQDPTDKWATFEPDHTHAGTLRNWLAQVACHPKPGDPDFTRKEAIANGIDALDLNPQSSLKPDEQFTVVEFAPETQVESRPPQKETMASRMARLAAKSPAPKEFQ
jgi:hypothetical protein